MRRHLPPLGALRAFEAVARLGSVTKAADAIGRTHGAVSRQLRQLQDALGAPLFDKDGVGIRLNADGRAFLQDVTPALDQLEAAFQALSQATAQPTVTIAASPSFAMLWLAPRLRSFYALHPEISVHLLMRSGQPDDDDVANTPQRIDIKLSWAQLTRPNADLANAEVIAPAEYGLVCRPDYPLTLCEGGGHAPTLLVHEQMAGAWEAWRARTGVALTHDAETPTPHAYLALGAAAAGVGAALLERRMVAQDMAAGRLIAPFGFLFEPNGVIAFLDPRRQDAPPIRHFIRWLKAEARLDEQA